MFCSDIQNSSSKCRGFQIHRLNTNHVCQSDSLCFNCTLSEHFSKSLFRIRNYKIELKQSFENSFLIHNAIIQLEEIYACRFDLRVFVANLRISPEHTCTTLYIITKFRTLKDTRVLYWKLFYISLKAFSSQPRVTLCAQQVNMHFLNQKLVCY